MVKKQTATKEKSNVITIDNKEYKAESLTEKAKFCINAIASAQTKKQQLQVEVSNADILLSHYTKELKKELIDL
tara:strand:- start:205 stop:426 length:222 start_codon:yes stop_codon:yes gene_type:complete